MGERPAGRAFSEEDLDFALTLARQAQAALESARLHRVRLEKQRQDRELQIAREIQQSLFPRDVAAGRRASRWRRRAAPATRSAATTTTSSRSTGGRLALAIADVSGKGTPASILMASVHASLRALAGTARPAQAARAPQPLPLREHADEPVRDAVLRRARPRAPPPRLRQRRPRPAVPERRGRAPRSGCTAGGPVLGLLEDVAFEAGELRLEPGDLLAMVTDGATEALSPGGRGVRRRAGAPGPGAAAGQERGRGALARLVGGGGRLGRAPPAAPTTSPPLILRAT